MVTLYDANFILHIALL